MNEDRLRRHLADRAADVDATPGDPANLKSRPANPLLVMGAGLALVAVFGAGLAWLLPAADDETETAAETTPTTIALAVEQGGSEGTQGVVRTPDAGSDLPPITAGDGPTLAWQSGQFPEGVWVSGIIPYGDGFLAWGQDSTAAAEGPPPLRLWRSGDGLEWADMEAQGFGADGDFWISSMLATDRALVAVGVAYDAPDVAAADSYYRPSDERTILLTSADGVSWESTEFTAQAAGATENPGEAWSSGQPMLAAQGDLVVLVTTQTLNFDPYLLVAEKLGVDGPEIGGLSYGSGRIEVYGVNGDEVIASYTPEELGIDPAYLENGGPLQTRSLVHISSDGGVTFESRDTTGLEDIGYLNGIVTTADGFIISGEQAFRDSYGSGQATWRSTDGVTWTKGEPLASGWLTSVTGFGDFIVGSGENIIVSFDGGASFSRVVGPAFDPVADLNFNVEQAKTGAFGTIAVGSAWQPGPPPPPLEVEVDGLIYREVYDSSQFGFNVGPRVTITDAATGEILFSKDNFWQPEHVSYDESAGDTVTFNSPENGEPLMTIDWSEFGLGDVGPLGDAESATIEKDGLNLTAEFGDMGIDRVVITEIASGDVLFDVDNVLTPSYIRQDGDGFTILDLDTGEPLMRLDYTTMERAYTEVTTDDSYQEPEMVLWFSGDGEAWSRQSMTEAFGVSGWSQAMAVGADRVIITVQPQDYSYPDTEEEARAYVPPPTQVWVGTLP